MLNTLTLRGYRGFESYRMPNLTRVNLVVGRNNCGKTSILEAIELLVACGHVSVFYGAARRRGETIPYVHSHSGPTIFATTHSYDCIHGLGTLVRTHPQIADQFSIHKLDQSLPQAVSLRGEHISVAVDQDIEVR